MIWKVFQSMRPRRMRLEPIVGSPCRYMFNPRARERSGATSDKLLFDQARHAFQSRLAKGARAWSDHRPMPRQYCSIHAPVKARRERGGLERSRSRVSIHAPVKARPAGAVATGNGSLFQSTRP